MLESAGAYVDRSLVVLFAVLNCLDSDLVGLEKDGGDRVLGVPGISDGRYKFLD